MAAVVKNLSSADQNLKYTEQKKISAAKKAYNDAKERGDTAGMEKAHADAEVIRINAGYSGGADGAGNTKATGWKYTGGKLDTSPLSAEDRANLSVDDQKKILALKTAYGAATDDNEKAYIHSLAEAIRKSNHYSGGDTGSDYSVLPYGQGGKSADEIKEELDAYKQKWWNPTRGWTNGYSVDMNVRSQANLVRQQMLANEQAMNDTNREELQAQNEQLASYLGGTTTWDDERGRWVTWNPNVGYGYNMNGTQDNIRNAWKRYYGYTDEEIEKWANDTGHYYNFVDVMAPARNQIDEGSGYTGQYAQFVNGPYAQLAWGTKGWQNKNVPWEDTVGDGFHDDEDYDAVRLPRYDENGNVIKTAPALKNNNTMSQYSAQFAPAAAGGVLAGQGANGSVMHPSGDTNLAGQRDYYVNYGANAGGFGSSFSSGASGGNYEDYLRQIYGEALAAQLKVLQSGYEQNISELDASQKQIDGAYTEQKRQTSGQAAQNAAAWREVANAYGLNSGAVGQASLAQRNQLQNDLNKLNAAQAAARTELQRQRMLLGRQYQLAIEAAVAENNGQLAKSLYQEAVRAEESLQQQEQYYANLALQYGKSMMSFAKSAGSGLSRMEQFSIIEDAVGSGYLTDAQGQSIAELLGYV